MHKLAKVVLISLFVLLFAKVDCTAQGTRFFGVGALQFDPNGLNESLNCENAFTNTLYSININSAALMNDGLALVYTELDFGFRYILPQKYETHAGTEMKLKGYMIEYSIFSVDLFSRRPKLDVLVKSGWIFGRYKINLDGEGLPSKAHYKNPIVGPKITTEIRFVLGEHLGFSLRGNYNYDISKGYWKHRPQGEGLTDIGKTLLRGPSASFQVGYMF